MQPEQQNTPFTPANNTPPEDKSAFDESVRPEQSTSAQSVPSFPSVEPPTIRQEVSVSPSPFQAPQQTVSNQPVVQLETSTDEAATDVSELTLYLVVLFSGLSTIASASYMVWSVLDYFMSKPAEYSLFDFSTFNIYVLIYLVLFAMVNILASLRLEKRLQSSNGVSGSVKTVGAIWRALLVVWGVSAIVGILYAPLSASIGESSETGTIIAKDIASSVFALLIVVLFFWRDTFVQKVRSGLVPSIAIAALVLAVASVSAYTTLSPKKAETPSSPYDYSQYNDSVMEDKYSDEEYNFDDSSDGSTN